VTDDPQRVYADSSALVKFVVNEPESEALRAAFDPETTLLSSRLAVVEVPRAVELQRPEPHARTAAENLLAECDLVEVSDQILQRARGLATRALRTLDAIHLATAVHVEATHLLSYDRRQLAAAADLGLEVSHPGLKL
jgi:predicted nucleic acid-binding protein